MVTQHLSGLIAAPFTPMYSNGSLNLELIPTYYEMLKCNGIKGAFICGSTGEGASLTTKEKMDIAEAWAACTRHDSDFLVMPLLGGTSIGDCKTLAVHARDAGLGAVSFTAPYYFRPASVEILARCCAEVASVVPEIPFYYYHIPVLTGVHFSMYELLKAVHERVPNFAGIKYTHEDLMDFLSCINFQNGKYDMLWGRDENMLPALSIGAKASVGSTFNYAAPIYHQLIAAFNNGDLETAAQCQQRAIDMIRLLGKYGGIGTGKAYMKLLGLNCGEFRLPVQNMSEPEFGQFIEDARQIGFHSFCSVLPEKTGERAAKFSVSPE